MTEHTYEVDLVGKWWHGDMTAMESRAGAYVRAATRGLRVRGYIEPKLTLDANEFYTWRRTGTFAVTLNVSASSEAAAIRVAKRQLARDLFTMKLRSDWCRVPSLHYV